MADPGFPMGGRAPIRRGFGPPTRVLFSENVCENERIGSHRGWRVPSMPPLDPPMNRMMVIGLEKMLYQF